MRLSLLLQATYDDLPSPINLRKWDLRLNGVCHLCGAQGMLSRASSACQIALAARGIGGVTIG